MPVEHIAILGAGPTGLEAALAAVEQGLSFSLYEASEQVAGHVRDWGHVRLFSPWTYDISPRARRVLEAAGVDLPAENDPHCPTGHQLVERVLEPIAALPQIRNHLVSGTRVVEIGRQGLLKHEEIASPERGSRPFRLLLENGAGLERTETADAILDCTGNAQPNAVGDAGIAAPGELAAEALIVRRVPDLERESGDWAGTTTLLVGAGHSAMTAIVGLSSLAKEHPGTKVLWALRNDQPSWQVDPEDPLPERSALVRKAREIAQDSSGAVTILSGVVVDSITSEAGGLLVRLRRTLGSDGPAGAGNSGGSEPWFEDICVDRILSLTGSVGDHHLYRQLQVHECYATSGPMKLAAALLGSAGSDSAVGADCLAQESHGADTLVSPEPNFFLLGAKSYGRNNSFLMRVGWQQVDEVFGLLAQAG